MYILRHLLKNLDISLKGIKQCWHKEFSFRLECTLFFVFSIGILWLTHSWPKRCILWASLLLVLVIELINSAIEKTTDLIVKERQHPLVKYAKDAASAAVMIGIIIAILIWISVLMST